MSVQQGKMVGKSSYCLDLQLVLKSEKKIVYLLNIELNPLLRNVVNGQTHFKNLAANAARFLKCV